MDDDIVRDLDEQAHTRQIPAVKRPTLITQKEHHVDLVITGLVMFASGFLAAAITFTVLK